MSTVLCDMRSKQYWCGFLAAVTVFFILTRISLPLSLNSHAKPPDIKYEYSTSTDHNSYFDHRLHHDDSRLAFQMAQEVRVLCWVMTAPKNLHSKAVAVRETWAKRCSKTLFFSSQDDANFTVVKLDVKEGRNHLTAKTMQAFSYIYQHFFNDYDWFLKADDDTYVIVENLRYFLSGENSREPVFFGHHFKKYLKQGFYSGGGGYVLSKEALRRFSTYKHLFPNKCPADGGSEDYMLGRCLESLKVKTKDSTDILGRSRFHCFTPLTHLHGDYPDWFLEFDSHGAKKGEESISDYAITFHYISPKQMYVLDFFVYHLRPYGIMSGFYSLNKLAKT